MALITTTHETHLFPLRRNDSLPPPPPPVAITPCDPWPRPYYLENGLRRVAPYHYTYNTFCKQRWRGREILDIFAAEFRDRSREYYQQAIESGQIAINGKPCPDIHTVVENGDVVSHTLHRHEPPVTAQPIRVIDETDTMIVIDKPAGVPVHPAGRYNYNSVVEIMRAERHYSFNPLPCNRLDRLTSGVMFIGKTSQEAEKISAKLRSRTVRKEYIARIKGRFPNGEGWDGNPMRGGVVTCEESILQISPILGLNRARASGKRAKTLFRRIAYYPTNATEEQGNNGHSIVHCLPLTGRTHQIRVHLQFLGHPITNDPIYSNRRVFGPTLARHDSSPAHDAAIIEKLSQMGKTELADAVSYDKPLNAGTMHAGSIPPPSSTDTAVYDDFVRQHDEMVTDYNKRKGEKMTGETCTLCDTPLYSDPGPQELGIFLHALAYADSEGMWGFRTEMPDWGMPPGQMEGSRSVTQWIYDGSETFEMDEDSEGNRRNRAGERRNKGEETE